MPTIPMKWGLIFTYKSYDPTPKDYSRVFFNKYFIMSKKNCNFCTPKLHYKFIYFQIFHNFIVEKKEPNFAPQKKKTLDLH
jgi:hypothetical protein